MLNSTKMLRNFTYITNPLKFMMKLPNAGMTVLIRKATCHFVIPSRSFKSNMSLLSQEKLTRDPSKIIKRDGTVIRKKTDPVIMINLLTDSGISVVTMKAAECMAKSKGLNLVKQETKSRSTRETYKLVKDSDLDKENLMESSKQDKELKTFIFSSAILDHDIQIKVKSVMKNLLKHKVVLCTIKKAGDNTNMETVAEKIKQEIKKTDVPVKFLARKASNNVNQFKVELVTDNMNKLESDNEKDKSPEK